MYNRATRSKALRLLFSLAAAGCLAPEPVARAIEATGDAIADRSAAAGSPSDGTRVLGGSPAGPEWSSDATPLGGLPSIKLTLLPGSLSSPVHVTNAHDGSNRLFVVEQTGTIRIHDNGTLLGTPFLDIHTLVSCCGERGLLSVAFHPNYPSNGYFYVYYTNPSGNLTIARYSVSAGNPNMADPSSAAIVLVVPHPGQSNHNGGQLFFGPNDGYLYAGTGDGGGGGDPPNNAQNLQVMLGKILRIDVDGTGAVPCGQASPAPYAIPADNPFVGSANACHEIWAYGLRNPFRYSFDRSTSDLWIGDVGQGCYEEIDLQSAASPGGENYGWDIMEGLHCFNPNFTCTPVACNPAGLVLPEWEETHTNDPNTNWCAIIGGYRYRGTLIPGLIGAYVYSDNCLGDLWAATDAGGGLWSRSLLLATPYSVSSFGEDEAGELYVCDLGGAVYRLDPTSFPLPAIGSLQPSAVIAGDPGFTLTVHGSGFIGTSVVRWNGADRATTYVSDTMLQILVPASDIASAGSAAVTVFNPSPGGGTSNPLALNINTTFLDVPISSFGYAYIEAIYNADVTAGCQTSADRKSTRLNSSH